MTNETSLKISHKTVLIKANSSLIVELNDMFCQYLLTYMSMESQIKFPNLQA